jgi:hypothetical protein
MLWQLDSSPKWWAFSGAYDNKTVIKFIKDYGFNQPHKAFSPSASTSEDFLSENVK